MDFLSKRNIEEYTEAEFIELLREFFENPRKLRGAALESHLSELSLHFKAIVEHPSGTDLIFYPAPGVEDSPEGVISVVKQWRSENGLSLFKTT